MSKQTPMAELTDTATATNEQETRELIVRRRDVLLQALQAEDELHAENNRAERIRHNAQKAYLQGDLRACRIALGEPLRPTGEEPAPAPEPAQDEASRDGGAASEEGEADGN